MLKACIVGILVIFFSCQESLARIWLVPDDRESVEQACIIAVDGDTILIRPGTYRANLSLNKNLVVGSLYLTTLDTAYIDSTILQGGGEGGIIEVFGEKSPTFSGLTITNGNRDSGGAFLIRNNSSPSILSCKITGNSSGIYCIEGSNAIIADCRIINNHSNSVIGGEGVYFRNCPRPQLLRTRIANNSGTGIYCRGNSNAVIVDCIIEQNQSEGINLWNSNPTIFNCTIDQNVDEMVGGVYFREGSNAILNNCTITRNIGEAFGGIACYSSNPQITTTTISGNIGGSVGGIRCAVGATPVFTDCIVSENTGLNIWGGIRCDGSSPIFNKCTIAGNISTEGCAGISLRQSSAEFYRCLIIDHISPGNGGAFCSSESNPTVIHCTIARNQSAVDGGVFYIEGGGTPVVLNSIIWENSHPAICLQSWGDSELERAGLNLSFSDLQFCDDAIITRGRVNLEPTKGCIDADPDFVCASEGNFHLREESPCIDAGSDGSPRDPDRTVADMGAFYRPQANLSLSRYDFSFEGVLPGERDSVDIVIRNIGLGNLKVDTLSLRSNQNCFRIMTNVRPFTLEPNERYIVRICFAPVMYGDNRGVLFIDSNDRDRPREFVHLRGNVLGIGDPGYLKPHVFEITEIFPNPFNNEAVISFTVPVPSQVNFDVLDLAGRRVMSIPSGQYPAGKNTINAGMKHLETGTYFLRVVNNDDVKIRKVVKIQ